MRTIERGTLFTSEITDPPPLFGDEVVSGENEVGYELVPSPDTLYDLGQRAVVGYQTEALF